MADLSSLPLPAAVPNFPADVRAENAIHTRLGTAGQAGELTLAPQTPNTDETKWSDFSGSYSKALPQNSPGIVDPAAFAAFRKALGSSNGEVPPSGDFEAIPPGHGAKLNGPQGAFALQPVGWDSQAFSVRPAPTVDSIDYAVELIELYWASLLRDVPFTDYPGNAIAGMAAAELTTHIGDYAGPTRAGKVTPELLFRGGFPGETVGPYLSQFCIYKTNLGVQPIDQMMQTFTPNRDFMTDPAEWFSIQGGGSPTATLSFDPMNRYMRNGRALAAFTHIDELYQAYLTAYLVLVNTWLVPFNVGTRYSPASTVGAPYKIQKPFGTFAGPDVTATLGYIARAAIDAVWYQKWVVHLRHRPEAGGGLVQLQKVPPAVPPKAKVNNIVLASDALAASYEKYGSYLLSQTFPEGSPTHPAYPTGHGTVAGACITALKFFFDCEHPVANFAQPMVPSSDGLSRMPYTGNDAYQMTVSGELHKLAHNISFGHGIHGGIHWRSDTDESILLGEQVALKFLQDQAWYYDEDISIDIKKIDGSTATIKNF